MRTALATLLLAAMWFWFGAPAAHSHALEPGYLEITAESEDGYNVFWRKPNVKGAPMNIYARLPENCETQESPGPWFDGLAWISRWTTVCQGGLASQTISIIGLESTNTDVLLRIQDIEGKTVNARLTPVETTFVVPERVGPWAVLATYVGLGTEHILEGFDHLLFVFALLLLISDGWRLLGAITAFTLAHSITLALASLGFVSVPGPPVEATIALSIVFLAVELAKRDDRHLRLSERWPWLVSFSFGLLHGLGFAGALSEIGLPEGDIFLALLGFNLGVEIGQLMFVGTLLALWYVLVRVLGVFSWERRENHGALDMVLSYAIGSVAAYWLIERVAGFWV